MSVQKDFSLRPYQQEIKDKGVKILSEKNILYLAMEMRTGKTFTSMSIAFSLYEKVGFITKKKAITGVNSDYDTMGSPGVLTVINYESIHKVEKELKDCDVVIIDEAQRLGAFPKPSKAVKQLKSLFHKKPIIFMSGTPTPESYSQIYHQLYISDASPFYDHANFYKWAKSGYVDVYQKKINSMNLNFYDRADESRIMNEINYFFISLTQAQAGFKTETKDHILNISPSKGISSLIEHLKKQKYYEFKKMEGTIICDTPATLMSATHQLSSGTIKIEDESHVLCRNKIDFITSKFKGKKIALFYKFVAFGNELKRSFPNWTNDQDEFNNSEDKTYISQFISGREGVNVATADAVIMCEIDYSATTYFQARMRGQSIDREENIVFWIISTEFEKEVFKAISKKKKYTLNHFKSKFI